MMMKFTCNTGELNQGINSALLAVSPKSTLLALEGISRYASFIAPVFFALNMVIIVHPLHAWLVRRLRWPVWLAATLRSTASRFWTSSS